MPPLSKDMDRHARAAIRAIHDMEPVPEDQQASAMMAHPYTPERLLRWGQERADAFCKANSLPLMLIKVVPRDDWDFPHVCAYWRESTCCICLPLCARVATEPQARNWNWPGCATDRTPYGVVCHELGHHVDWHCSPAAERGAYWGSLGTRMHKESGEKRITSYCPDSFEWFAEMFRVYCCNHALLHEVRPRTWELMLRQWEPVSDINWLAALGKGCPDRIIKAQLKR